MLEGIYSTWHRGLFHVFCTIRYQGSDHISFFRGKSWLRRFPILNLSHTYVYEWVFWLVVREENDLHDMIVPQGTTGPKFAEVCTDVHTPVISLKYLPVNTLHELTQSIAPPPQIHLP